MGAASVLALDDAGVADHVVQGAFLGIEAGHDIADHQNHAADDFGEVAAGGAAGGDGAAIGPDHLESQRHLAGRGAEAAGPKSTIQEARESAEREHILRALDESSWNV